MSAVPRTVVLLQLLAARLASSGPLSHPVSGTSRRLGQCAGLAYNYHRAVAAHQDCLQLCDCDREARIMADNIDNIVHRRCDHWSYFSRPDQSPHPHQAHCYLYTSNQCSDLR